jgi:hypothetical protein
MAEPDVFIVGGEVVSIAVERPHGETKENPCPNARCAHCGWSGTFPTA